MALPLLLVFGYLFASADMQFEKLMRDLLRWDLRTVCLHVMTIAVCAWAIAGYLRCMFVPADAQPARREPGANAIGPASRPAGDW